jgi:hypothetical protein
MADNKYPTVADLIKHLKTFDQSATIRICTDKYKNEWETLTNMYELEYYVCKEHNEVAIG